MALFVYGRHEEIERTHKRFKRLAVQHQAHPLHPPDVEECRHRGCPLEPSPQYLLQRDSKPVGSHGPRPLRSLRSECVN